MMHLLDEYPKTWFDGKLVHVADIVNSRSARWGAICGASSGIARKDVHGGRKRGLVNCFLCLGVLRDKDLARRNARERRRRP